MPCVAFKSAIGTGLLPRNGILNDLNAHLDVLGGWDAYVRYMINTLKINTIVISSLKYWI